MRNLKKYFLIGLLGLSLLSTSVWAQQVSYPFSPGATINIAVTNSASSATLVGTTLANSNGTQQVMVTNTGTNTCFVNFGSSSVTSSATTSIPVPGGAIEVFTINQNQKYVSAITAASTTTCYFTIGIGN